MTPEQLKASILQLAIQGKLVPQRPDEGTAEELYQQIQKEKKKLTAAGKLKKEKPLPPITEEEIPFDIPESWKWVRLGEMVLKLGSGSTPTGGRRVYVNAGVKFIRSQNVYNDGLRLSGVAFISEEINNKHYGSQVKPQDVLLNITGASIGRCAVVPDDFDLANVNQHVMIIRLIDKTLRKWVHLAMISPYIQQLIMDVQVGVSREGLSATKLAHFLIPMPPLAEQQRIVEKIEQMFPLVEQYGEAYTALESLDARFPDGMRKSILQYAIQGKLVPQRPEEGTAEDLYQQIQKEKKKLIAAGKLKKEKLLPPISEEEIPFDIPDSWKWVRLPEIVYNVGDKTNQILAKEVKKVGAYPAVSQGQELIDGYTDKSEKVIHDLPLVMFGDHTRNVKFVNFPFVISADGTKFMKAICVAPTYLYYWMKCAAERLRNRGYARHFSLLKKELVPLPPLAEQQRIVKKIEEMMKFCTE